MSLYNFDLELSGESGIIRVGIKVTCFFVEDHIWIGVSINGRESWCEPLRTIKDEGGGANE